MRRHRVAAAGPIPARWLELIRSGPLMHQGRRSAYNWEQTEIHPRQEFLDKIALIRGLSRARVGELLGQHSATRPSKAKAKTVGKKKAAQTKMAPGKG